MNRKTDEQIAVKVAALQECVPRFTLSSGDNPAAIDAQCTVLIERMSRDEVYEA